MKQNRQTRILSMALCILLIAASALCITSCQDEKVRGEGEKSFTFVVVDKEGQEKTYEIRTDKATVGEALLDEGLIAGDESEYGLYVKTVDGITADYETDGFYWAFYIGEEYAMTGVDSTEITEGETYSFKAEKG